VFLISNLEILSKPNVLVRLSFKSLALHHSQKELISNENEYRIELFLQPTYDFVMELMSIGAEVKVLEPESLKKEVIEKLEATLNRYK